MGLCAPWSSNSYKQDQDSIEVKLQVQTQIGSQQRGAVDYYSDLGANESQQASSNPKIDYAIAASYNYLISKQELKAYQQGYQPEIQAKATEDSDKDILPSFT